MVSGYAQKFKMAEPSDNQRSSEDDEYSDALEVAASRASILAKYVLFEYNHVVIEVESQYRESAENLIFMIWVERESVSQY